MINSNFGRILHRCQDFDAWSSKFAPFAYPSSFEAPTQGGDPLEFLDKTYPGKTRGMGLLYGENSVILASTVFDWSIRVTDGQTDRRTDGIAMAYTRYSIYAVARKNRYAKCKILMYKPIILAKNFSLYIKLGISHFL